jgi:ATP-dependent Lhr-like helicase
MRGLRRPAETEPELDGRQAEIVGYLRQHGASFFGAIRDGTGGGFPNETVDALWELVWTGLDTNDTLHPLRAYVRIEDKKRKRPAPGAFRSRRVVPRTAEGRWALVDGRKATKSAATEWAAVMAQQLLSRHGIVTRETVASEAVAGGFSAVYQVLKAMEDAGRIRRGYFVAGLGAAQFALPAALDLLRSMRETPETPRTAVLAATDPGNPYGAIVKWPEDSAPDAGRGPTRSVGGKVILVDGAAAAYLRRGERELLLFLPGSEPSRSRVAREVARMLLHLAMAREAGRQGMLIVEINGEPAASHAIARVFVEEGFLAGAMGLQVRPVGTVIAGRRPGGNPMAEPRDLNPIDTPRVNERDEDVEREDIQGATNDEIRNADDVDPDSAESDVDRDDTVTD